jgi:hypothetical protein
LEQVLPRQLLTGFDDPCYPPVLYLQAPRLAALALEVETQFATCHRNVTAAQRCQGIILIADPDQRRLEQIDYRREYLFARQSTLGHVAIDTRADGWKSLREFEQVLIFRGIAHLAPARMIAILLSAFVITAGRLDMAVRIGTNPDVAVDRRHG